ncbi:expressed unknown protein [Seminavis robusta]|uniref:Uncharacterized protein n=1 Tax=Seminavis robusta TaxID=568900 RepID=A0A9N8DZV0_9STRA|nr:expressed unknown protein [Seminavis robusta]|eukprot:Sro510_g157260.1 n/a (86) ;mRNA; r:34838-35095
MNPFKKVLNGIRKNTEDPPGEYNGSSSNNVHGLKPIPKKTQAVELGTIDYINLTPDGKHGDFNAAVQASLETGKPIFANFVEWSG